MSVRTTAVPTTLQAYLMPGTTGLPAPAGSIPAALQALLSNSADGAQQFFAQQNFAANLVNDLNSGNIPWNTDTDVNGNPMYFAATTDDQGNAMYLTLEMSAAPPPGTTSFPQYTAPDGQQYDVTGSFTASMSWNNNSMWAVNVPFGFVSGTGALILEYYAWDSFMKPMLQGLLAGFKKLCASAVDCVDAAMVGEAGQAGESAAAVNDAAVGTDATISMTAGAFCFAGAALLIALPFVLSAIEHPTGHNVKIYNLTPFDLNWQSPPYVDDCAMTEYPASSDGTNTPQTTIPAPTTLSPPGGQPVTTYSEGDFAFQSTSSIRGISWAMQITFTDPNNGNAQVGQTAAMMFDLPLNVANSLAAAWGAAMTADALQSWAEQNYGQISQPQIISIDETSGLQMTLTYNALSGEQPLPGNPDEEGYVYQSAIVFQYQVS